MRTNKNATEDKGGTAIAGAFSPSNQDERTFTIATATVPNILDIPSEWDVKTVKSTYSIQNPVYRWEIPSDALPGYILPIDITDAKNLEEARATALQIRIGVIEGSATQKADEGRELTRTERAYVLQEEPQVVCDSEQITLTHAMAVYLNERLTTENEGLQRIKEVLTEYGIDPENPQVWIDGQMGEAAALVSVATEAFDLRGRQFAQGIERAIDALRTTAHQTGFATPAPAIPPEPDYSKLTIFTPNVEETAQEFPRLSAANIIEYVPGEELSKSEALGAHMLTKPGGYLEAARRGFVTPSESEALKAIQARIKAEWKA